MRRETKISNVAHNKKTLRRFIRFQLEQMSASNEQHTFEQLSYELAKLRIGAILIAILPRVAPEAVSAAKAIISEWVIEPEYLALISDAGQREPWASLNAAAIYEKIQLETGQNFTNDLESPARIRWSALGIEWTIVAPDQLRTVGEQLAATLQIVQVDLSDLDLLIVSSNVEIVLVAGGGATWEVDQRPDNGRLVWELQVPASYVDGGRPHDPQVVEEAATQTLALTIMVLRQVSALPEDKFMKSIEKRMERGLVARTFWVRPALELMREARGLAIGDNGSLPPLVTPQPDIRPLAAPALAAKNTESVLYSRKQALEMVKNRYERLMPLARQIVPTIMADPRTRIMMLDLHDDGLLDWQIISILFNLTLNQHAESQLGRVDGYRVREAEALMRDESTRLIGGGEPNFSIDSLTRDALEIQRRMQTMVVSKSWGLVNNRATPDFLAIERMLVERFHQAEDDLAHEDVFQWEQWSSGLGL